MTTRPSPSSSTTSRPRSSSGCPTTPGSTRATAATRRSAPSARTWASGGRAAGKGDLPRRPQPVCQDRGRHAACSRRSDALRPRRPDSRRAARRARGPARARRSSPTRSTTTTRSRRAAPGPRAPHPRHPNGCRLTAWVRNRPTVVLWGDSHAWQNIPALIKAANAEQVNLTAFVMGKCPPSKIRIQKRYPGQCERSNALALKYVRETAQRPQPVQVILGSHWAGFAAEGRRVRADRRPAGGLQRLRHADAQAVPRPHPEGLPRAAPDPCPAGHDRADGDL